MDRVRERMLIGWLVGAMVIAGSGRALVWAQAEPDGAGAGADADAGAAPALPGGERDPWMRGVPRAPREAASGLFSQGNALMRDAFFAEAAARYREAIARWDHPAFHYNLAMAQRLLDQPVAAHASLGKALQYGEAPLGRDKHAHALRVRALLEQQLARVDIACDQAGAAVALDGEHLFSGPGRYRGLLRPGVHQLAASKAGHVPESKLMRLEPGRTTRVALVLVPIADMFEERRWAQWKPWAVVGAGAAVAVAGGVLHWRAAEGFRRFDEDFDALCRMSAAPGESVPGCLDRALPPALAGRLERATWQRNAAAAAYVAGGALFATGLVLVYLNQPGMVEARQPVPVMPVVGRNAVQVLVQTRF